MLPLSGEQRKGPGSGKCANTQPVSLGLRGSHTRVSALPKTQHKRSGLGFWAHTCFSTPLPNLFLVFPPIYSTFQLLSPPWLGKAPWRQPWSTGFWSSQPCL